MGRSKLFIFSHVRKCAGTTIIKDIINNVDQEAYLHVHFDEFGTKVSTIPGVTDREALKHFFSELPQEKKDKLKYIVGHDVYHGIHEHFEDREPYYFTFLRDPVDRIKSLYNFTRTLMEKGDTEAWMRWFIDHSGNPFTFREWTERLPNGFDQMTEHLLTFSSETVNSTNAKQENILNSLRLFDFIGFTKDKKDFSTIYQTLNIGSQVKAKNISKNFIDSGENAIASETLQSKVKLDKEMLQMAMTLKLTGARNSQVL